MTYEVILSHEARRNLRDLFAWVRERSEPGALRWYAAFLKAGDSLKHDPVRFATAPESEAFAKPIRQVLFKTKHGRTYRLLFAIPDLRVEVLYVRGPGEPPVTA